MRPRLEAMTSERHKATRGSAASHRVTPAWGYGSAGCSWVSSAILEAAARVDDEQASASSEEAREERQGGHGRRKAFQLPAGENL